MVHLEMFQTLEQKLEWNFKNKVKKESNFKVITVWAQVLTSICRNFFRHIIYNESLASTKEKKVKHFSNRLEKYQVVPTKTDNFLSSFGVSWA